MLAIIADAPIHNDILRTQVRIAVGVLVGSAVVRVVWMAAKEAGQTPIRVFHRDAILSGLIAAAGFYFVFDVCPSYLPDKWWMPC